MHPRKIPFIGHGEKRCYKSPSLIQYKVPRTITENTSKVRADVCALVLLTRPCEWQTQPRLDIGHRPTRKTCNAAPKAVLDLSAVFQTKQPRRHGIGAEGTSSYGRKLPQLSRGTQLTWACDRILTPGYKKPGVGKRRGSQN